MSVTATKPKTSKKKGRPAIDLAALVGKEYLTRRESSALFSVSPATIDQFVHSRDNPLKVALVVGRRYLFRREDLIKYFERAAARQFGKGARA